MSKQSSIEQKVFKSSLDLLLYYLPSAIRGQFKEQIEQAKAMHKQEILIAYSKALPITDGVFTAIDKAHDYYNKTFGGNNE